MGFPGTVLSPADAYRQATATAGRLKKESIIKRAVMIAGDISFDVVMRLRDDLINADALFATAAAVPGIVEYARAQNNDPDYDIIADFVAMRNAVSAALTAVEAALPQSGGFLLRESIVSGVSGTTVRSFTSQQAETAGIPDKLADVIASID